MLPGVIVALGIAPYVDAGDVWWRLLVGLLAVCLVASSNYVLNELIDAPLDVHHPTKQFRPVPSGQVNIPLAYAQWIALMLAGLGARARSSRGSWCSRCSRSGSWGASTTCRRSAPRTCRTSTCCPRRSTTRSGCSSAGSSSRAPWSPPLSLLVSYWMIGCYFMAVKRFAEYRDIGAPVTTRARYRKSFAHYTSERLLVSIMFYASTAMLFFGAFIVRYRLELILVVPARRAVHGDVPAPGVQARQPGENPEKLYRERGLMLVLVVVRRRHDRAAPGRPPVPGRRLPAECLTPRSSHRTPRPRN